MMVEAISDGTQPRPLTRKMLLASPIPSGWAEQAWEFGFPVCAAGSIMPW